MCDCLYYMNLKYYWCHPFSSRLVRGDSSADLVLFKDDLEV